jgi:hypothetical protein
VFGGVRGFARAGDVAAPSVDAADPLAVADPLDGVGGPDGPEGVPDDLAAMLPSANSIVRFDPDAMADAERTASPASLRTSANPRRSTL